MRDDDPKLLGWMRLARCPRCGPRHALHVAERLGDVTRLVTASPGFTAPAGLDAGAWRELTGRRLGQTVRRELEQLRRLGWVPLHREDPAYPPLLADSSSGPPVLVVRGDLDGLLHPAIAVVGTRRPTRYGVNMARRLAGDLARRGLTIVSGLAHGIDAAAHRSALEVGGRTIAVMGTGPDRIYPTHHGDLAEEITARGGLVTELPPGSPPRRSHFPQRNRIIAGISAAIVVVEAAGRSGSLLTARWGLSEGREVLAVPGRVTESAAEGTLGLIRDGAPLACCADDVLVELPEPLRTQLLEGWTGGPTGGGVSAPPLPPGLDEGCRELLAALSPDEERPLDLILEAVEMPPDRVLTGLFALELAGVVEVRPGQRYLLKPRPVVRHT
jgi:DNA processing protein